MPDGSEYPMSGDVERRAAAVTKEHELLEDIKVNTGETAAAVTAVADVAQAAVPGIVQLPTVTTQKGDTVATPTTTEEEDRNTAGQRQVSIMWEGTQRIIAIGFAYGSILICTYVIILGPTDLKLAALTYILTMGATVNQSYFTRTNHTKVGGVKYEGR